MRSLKLGLLVFALAAGLVGLWWGLGRPAPASAHPTEMELSPHSAAAPAVALDPVAVSAADERAPSSMQRAELEPPPLEAASAEVVDAVLTGRVVDELGEPVAGARVLAATGFAWMLVPLRMDGPAFDRTTSSLYETSTDAQGRFAFGDTLQAGRLRIAVSAPGMRPLHQDSLTLGERRPHDLGDLVIEPGVVLAGRVVDALGEPVPGARLLEAIVAGVGGSRVSIQGRGIPLTTTDASGRFRVDQLAEGPWHLIVDAQGFLVEEVSGRTQAPPDREAGSREPGSAVGGEEDLVVTLQRGGAISGKVVGADAQLLSELHVEARIRLQDREDPESVPFDDVSARARSADCDALGRFEVSGLPAGVAHVLTVWSRDRRGVWRRDAAFDPVEAWPGTEGAELPYKPPASLAFTVVDQSSDEPVTDFVAWVGVDGGAAALRDEAGKVIRHHPGGRVVSEDLGPKSTSGLARIRVRAAGYAEREETDIVVERGELRDLGRVMLSPAPRVVARVTDARTGEPVAGARVFLAVEGDRNLAGYAGERDDDELYADASVCFARSDAQGVALLPAAAGSVCGLLVVSAAHAPKEVAGVFVPPAGEAEVALSLFEGATVAVEVTDDAGQPVAGVSVEQAEMDREQDGQRLFDLLHLGRVDPTTDASGVVRFEHLRGGEHGFRAARAEPARGGQLKALGYVTDKSEPDDTWSRVQVDEGGEYRVRVHTAARGVLSGRVTEGGRALAGASLRLVASAEEADEGRGGAAAFTRTAGASSTAYSEPDGDYHFTGVPVGTYELTLTHADRRMAAVWEIDVTPGAQRLDLDIAVSTVQGRVTLESGAPVSGIEVTVKRGGTKKRYSLASPHRSLREDAEGRLRVDRHYRERTATTDENGEYELRGVASDEPLEIAIRGPLIVNASRDDIVVGPDDVETGVDFVAEGAGQLEVRVVGNSLPRSFRVRASRMVFGEEEGQPKRETRSTVLWGNRVRRMRSLPAGTWQLELLPYDRTLSEPLARASVEVRAGGTSSVVLEL